MVSIEVSGGDTPRTSVRDVVDWGRVVVATVARGLVATLLGLAIWAAAPAVLGWMPTTVMTGSMEPRLRPGDVVVSRPVAPVEVREGRILLADDPDRAGHLRMHRYVQDGPRDTIITKGDANPAADSTPTERSAVHGVGFLRIPYIASPIVWMRDGQWGRVLLLLAGVVVVLGLCTVDGSLRRLVDDLGKGDDGEGDDDVDGNGDGADRSGSPVRGTAGREARTGAEPGLPSGGRHAGTRRALTRHARTLRRRRDRRLRRTGGALLVLALAGVAALAGPSTAEAAPWRTTTVTTTGTLSAATAVAPTAVTCHDNGDGSVQIGWTATGVVAASSFSVLDGTRVAATAPATATSARLTSSSFLSLGSQLTITVRTNLSGTWTATSSTSVKVQTQLVGTSVSCV